MKAIKKPIPIEVEEFRPEQKPWPKGVSQDLSGLGPAEYFVWNALHGSKINLKPGDFVNVSNENDLYPIDRATFEATYTRVP